MRVKVSRNALPSDSFPELAAVIEESVLAIAGDSAFSMPWAGASRVVDVLLLDDEDFAARDMPGGASSGHYVGVRIPHGLTDVPDSYLVLVNIEKVATSLDAADSDSFPEALADHLSALTGAMLDARGWLLEGQGNTPKDVYHAGGVDAVNDLLVTCAMRRHGGHLNGEFLPRYVAQSALAGKLQEFCGRLRQESSVLAP